MPAARTSACKTAASSSPLTSGDRQARRSAYPAFGVGKRGDGDDAQAPVDAAQPHGRVMHVGQRRFQHHQRARAPGVALVHIDQFVAAAR